MWRIKAFLKYMLKGKFKVAFFHLFYRQSKLEKEFWESVIPRRRKMDYSWLQRRKLQKLKEKRREELKEKFSA